MNLTLATINLRHNADRWRERRQLLLAQLLDAAPDLISLQEVSFPIGQGTWLRKQINVRLTGSTNQPYQLVQKRKHHFPKGYYEGIGILTKLPVLDQDWVALGYGGRVALRVNVELPTRQTVDFVAIHLHHISTDKQARQEQVMKMMNWLNGRRRVPRQIIAGDFNETPTGPAIQTMKQAYHSAYELANGREPIATFPTALVQRPTDWTGCLDYIFLSKAIDGVKSAKIFCDKAAPDDDTLYPSDHVGLLANLTIK
ncbi:MAG: endonuclease/exonuclease/phosphatase family protein [Ardenticatenaceae bacterium]|nr:endonuclease/exonuclease/phosphatase family protein [Ardenticatenaceae bacterium]